jgi:hypothetical protein
MATTLFITAFATVMVLAAPQHPVPTGACRLDALTPSSMNQDVLTRFDQAVGAYVALHRRVEQARPHERIYADAGEMLKARHAFRAALLRERGDVAAGTVFTPPIARAFVEQLAFAISECGHDPAEILADIGAERPPGTPKPRVNGRFPWAAGAAVWPTLLRALPELPAELEYRFVDRDLVLIDIHANVVVDILASALPPPGH